MSAKERTGLKNSQSPSRGTQTKSLRSAHLKNMPMNPTGTVRGVVWSLTGISVGYAVTVVSSVVVVVIPSEAEDVMMTVLVGTPTGTGAICNAHSCESLVRLRPSSHAVAVGRGNSNGRASLGNSCTTDLRSKSPLSSGPSGSSPPPSSSGSELEVEVGVDEDFLPFVVLAG
jgi:hypothetical protein